VAGASLSPRVAAGIHLPLPLARGLDRLLGKPGDLALRRKRLQRRAPADASRHRRRLRPATGDDVDLGYCLSLMVVSGMRVARLEPASCPTPEASRPTSALGPP